MLTLPKVLFATALTFGFVAGHANAQDKHATTINQCTVIDKPGAYQLGKVLQVSQSDLTEFRHPLFEFPLFACVLITTDLVTFDLGGNAIIGPGTFDSFGIATSFSKRNVKVHSGAVTNFAFGVLMSGEGHTVEHINASRNANSGIVVPPPFVATEGVGHRVIGNTANFNGSTGIFVKCPSVLIGNMATGNHPELAFDIVTDGTCRRSHNFPMVGDVP